MKHCLTRAFSRTNVARLGARFAASEITFREANISTGEEEVREFIWLPYLELWPGTNKGLELYLLHNLPDLSGIFEFEASLFK